MLVNISAYSGRRDNDGMIIKSSSNKVKTGFHSILNILPVESFNELENYILHYSSNPLIYHKKSWSPFGTKL
jgi:hypothetical protein